MACRFTPGNGRSPLGTSGLQRLDLLGAPAMHPVLRRNTDDHELAPQRLKLVGHQAMPPVATSIFAPVGACTSFADRTGSHRIRSRPGLGQQSLSRAVNTKGQPLQVCQGT
jgi:hypothetical protein